MIRQLFLPDRVGDFFIGTHTHVGLEITKSALVATTVQVSGRTVLVTDAYQEPIVKADEETWEQAVVRALIQLGKKIGPAAAVRMALPNNIVVFKELTLPFIDVDKIRQVLPFELEQQIPFSIADVAFDFIVTAVAPDKKSSQILVGIVQKKDLTYYVDLFDQAHVELASLTVDMFALYTMWLVHPRYAALKGAVALIDLNSQFSTIAYIKNQQLCAVRTLAHGVNSFIKSVADRTKKTPAVISEHLVRFGIEKTDESVFDQAVSDEIAVLCSPIQMTFEAFATQIHDFESIARVVVLVRGLYFKGLDQHMREIFGIPTASFDTINIFNPPQLRARAALPALTSVHVLSLGAVYPFGYASRFDVLSAYETKKSEQLIRQQLITGALVFMCALGLLLSVGYWRYFHVRAQVRRARAVAVQQLNQEFGITEKNLPAAVNSAQQELDARETIWEGFSIVNRHSFLKYLQELCVKIDRVGIGLQLQHLAMTKKSIMLKGSVRDYKALKVFEEELAGSKLFALVSIPQETSFEVKLVITNGQE